jgi:segregation and condensation protein B
MNREELKHILEALIFASKTPLTIKQVIAILPEETPETIQAAAAELQDTLHDRAFALKKVAGGYQFASKPEYSQWISKMFEEKERSRLSRAALETLAIVAFKQPISRVEISAIRGVNSDGVMKTLLDARLVTISGRDHGPGRALLFKTTHEFLHYFGINEISDLPRPREVEELLAEGEGGQLLKDLPDELLLSDAGTIAEGGSQQMVAETVFGDGEEKAADDTAQ